MMKKNFYKVLVLLTALPIFITSCATLFGRSSYPISIKSDPPGATVSITDKKGKEIYKGASPDTVTLKSGKGYFGRAEYQVKITKPGYDEQIIPINFKLNAWYFGNLLVSGVVGMLIIDPITGAMWKLETPPINVTLNKTTTALQLPTLKIVDIANLPQHIKEKLIPIK